MNIIKQFIIKDGKTDQPFTNPLDVPICSLQLNIATPIVIAAR